jgi:hypothetical protein
MNWTVFWRIQQHQSHARASFVAGFSEKEICLFYTLANSKIAFANLPFF